METRFVRSNEKLGGVFETFVSHEDMAFNMPLQIHELVMQEVSKLLSAEIVKTKGQEIIARIDPQAIANMTIAESAAAINETLHKKMPDKIMEIVKTERETIERGFFGGIKRITRH